MKLTNVQLINADNALGDVAQQKVKGAIAFKLFRLKHQLEHLTDPVRRTLESIGIEDQSEVEFQKILAIEQEIEPIEMLNNQDLNELILTLAQASYLSHFIKLTEKEGL